MESIESLKHPDYQLALSLTQPRGREIAGAYLAEGANLVAQALDLPAQVRCVFASPDEAQRLRARCAAAGVKILNIRPGLLTKLSGTGYETAVTALAVMNRVVLAENDIRTTGDTLLLACERIQDPRNVGVLVRTAEAAGCSAIILSADSADPFSRAAVRSTTGSILRIPVCIARELPVTLTRLAAAGVRVVAGSARAASPVYDAPPLTKPLAVLVGNETIGVSEAARAAASEYVALPMAGGASSLNVTVAAGILLYECIRATAKAR